MITVLDGAGLIAQISLLVIALFPFVVSGLRRAFWRVDPITLDHRRSPVLAFFLVLIITGPTCVFIVEELRSRSMMNPYEFVIRYLRPFAYVAAPVLATLLRPIAAAPLDSWDAIILLLVGVPLIVNFSAPRIDLLYNVRFPEQRLLSDFNALYLTVALLLVLLYGVLRPLPDTGLGSEMRLPRFHDALIVFIGLFLSAAALGVGAAAGVITRIPKDATDPAHSLSPLEALLGGVLSYLFLAVPLEVLFRGAIQGLIHAALEAKRDQEVYTTIEPIKLSPRGGRGRGRSRERGFGGYGSLAARSAAAAAGGVTHESTPAAVTYAPGAHEPSVSRSVSQSHSRSRSRSKSRSKTTKGPSKGHGKYVTFADELDMHAGAAAAAADQGENGSLLPAGATALAHHQHHNTASSKRGPVLVGPSTSADYSDLDALSSPSPYEDLTQQSKGVRGTLLGLLTPSPRDTVSGGSDKAKGKGKGKGKGRTAGLGSGDDTGSELGSPLLTDEEGPNGGWWGNTDSAAIAEAEGKVERDHSLGGSTYQPPSLFATTSPQTSSSSVISPTTPALAPPIASDAAAAAAAAGVAGGQPLPQPQRKKLAPAGTRAAAAAAAASAVAAASAAAAPTSGSNGRAVRRSFYEEMGGESPYKPNPSASPAQTPPFAPGMGSDAVPMRALSPSSSSSSLAGSGAGALTATTSGFATPSTLEYSSPRELVPGVRGYGALEQQQQQQHQLLEQEEEQEQRSLTHSRTRIRPPPPPPSLLLHLVDVTPLALPSGAVSQADTGALPSWRSRASDISSPLWAGWRAKSLAEAKQRGGLWAKSRIARWLLPPRLSDVFALLVGAIIFAGLTVYPAVTMFIDEPLPGEQEKGVKDVPPATWVAVAAGLAWLGLVCGWVWRQTCQVWASAVVAGVTMFVTMHLVHVSV